MDVCRHLSHWFRPPKWRRGRLRQLAWNRKNRWTESRLISWPTEYPSGLLHQAIVHRNCFRESFHSLIGCGHLVCRYRGELTTRSSFLPPLVCVWKSIVVEWFILYGLPLENTTPRVYLRNEFVTYGISMVDDRDFRPL